MYRSPLLRQQSSYNSQIPAQQEKGIKEIKEGVIFNNMEELMYNIERINQGAHVSYNNGVINASKYDDFDEKRQFEILYIGNVPKDAPLVDRGQGEVHILEINVNNVKTNYFVSQQVQQGGKPKRYIILKGQKRRLLVHKSPESKLYVKSSGNIVYLKDIRGKYRNVI